MNKAKKAGYQTLGAIKVIVAFGILIAGAVLGYEAKEHEYDKIEEAKKDKPKFTGYNTSKF